METPETLEGDLVMPNAYRHILLVYPEFPEDLLGNADSLGCAARKP